MSQALPFVADFISADTLAICIPIMALMIPIIAVLTNHQRQMAKIIHGGNENNRFELDSMRSEIERLRATVEDQARTIAQMKDGQPDRPPVVGDDLQNRVGF